MLKLRLEKKYWEETRKRIGELEERNPHRLDADKLSKALARVLNYSADILEHIDAQFTSVSTLSGNRKDATLTLEIDDKKSTDYGSRDQVESFMVNNVVIKKKIKSISLAFGLLELARDFPYHNTDVPMIEEIWDNDK